jgi:hypothetical protein
MAYVAPSTRSAGALITAAIWNQDVVANPIAIYAGAMSLASQTALDFIYASSATQLGRLAAVASKYPRLNASGSAWEMNVPTAGKHELYVPAPAMRPLTSGGCGPLEDATSTNVISGMPFDATSSEGAYFWIALPKGWNEGTITGQFYTFNKAGGSGNFVFSLAGLAVSDDDSISGSLGTAQQVTDGILASYDVQIGPETAAITIAGTPATGDLVLLVAKRLPADAADTYGSDVYLAGVKLRLTTDTETDD